MTRRGFMTVALTASAAGLFWRAGRGVLASTTQAAPSGKSARTFEVTKTDAEWRSILTPEQFNILRKAATETPFSSPLNKEHRAGTFSCAGCALPLFKSETKFDSGTGWPSFYAPLDNAVITARDSTFRPAAVRSMTCWRM